MFNLDNLDLDIDDDFSSNIFSKSVDLASIHETEKGKVWEKNHVSVENTLNYEIAKSTNELHKPIDSNYKSSPDNLLDFPLIKYSRENSLKRPCAQDEKLPKKRLLNSGLLERKFPGPAGLLPDKPCKEISDLAVVTDKVGNENENEDEGSKEKEMVFSQNSGSVFLESSYQKLLSDFSLNESGNPLNRFTIEWVKKTALRKGFRQRKIPFLGLVVHSVNQGISDSILVLRDPTGEIHGSLHKEIWLEMGGKLRAGIALALRQVGVLITGVIRRQIYLNITMNNILSLYSPFENRGTVEITIVNKVSKQELMKSFEDCLVKSSKNKLANSPLDSQLFTTVSFPSNDKKDIQSLQNRLENLIDKLEKKNKSRERNTEEVLANLGITLNDNDFREEMNIPQMDSTLRQVDLFENVRVSTSSRTSTQILSQAESLIFEEVLSGINLDEFET